MKLCGLDFETANSSSDSICVVTAALLEDDTVLEHRGYHIISHKTMDYISKFCRGIYGIIYKNLRKNSGISICWFEYLQNV